MDHFFVSCVSHDFASVHCCLVVTCWERVDLLALVGDVDCILLLSHVVSWVMLIVSFPDLCHFSYFVKRQKAYAKISTIRTQLNNYMVAQ